MTYRLDKDVISSLEKGVEYEWLETNKLGAYASSTVLGLNTRREHGLLVIPDWADDQNKIVLLSKLEESVFIDNRLHEISTNQYQDTVFPEGFNYLSSFEIDPFPTFEFCIEDRLLRKTILLLEDRNLLLVRYELCNMGYPVKLVIKPFIAQRNFNELSHETQGVNTDSYQGDHFVRWAPRPGTPDLYIYYNDAEFYAANLWYHNFLYVRDNGTDDNFTEDLFNPGFFQTELKPYQTLDLFVTTSEIDGSDLDFERLFRREAKRRGYPEQSTRDHLWQIKKEWVRAVDAGNESSRLPTSFLKKTGHMRDTLFSMQTCLLSKKHIDLFKTNYLSIAGLLQGGLLPIHYPAHKDKNHYSAADLSLYFINLGFYYFKISRDLKFFESDILDLYRSIIDNYLKGTSFNIYCDKDGLIFCGDKYTSVSWIPLTNGDDHVLRYGKLLEVNALWYNALKIVEFFHSKLHRTRQAKKYAKLAENVAQQFNNSFPIEHKFAFYDFIRQDKKCLDFRINQIIPLALPFCMVPKSFGKKVLFRIDEELKTPYGLRSQSPNDESYRKYENRNLSRKIPEFYTGAIWPWTISFYIQARINYKTGEHSTSRLRDYLSSVLQLMDRGILGYVPEVIQDDEHVRQAGIMDYLSCNANIIWADHILSGV